MPILVRSCLVPILKLVRRFPTARVLATFSSTHSSPHVNKYTINTPPCSTSHGLTINQCLTNGMECDSSVMYALLYIKKWENGKQISLWWQETYYLTQVYTRVSLSTVQCTVESVSYPQFLIVRPYLELCCHPTGIPPTHSIRTLTWSLCLPPLHTSACPISMSVVSSCSCNTTNIWGQLFYLKICWVLMCHWQTLQWFSIHVPDDAGHYVM